MPTALQGPVTLLGRILLCAIFFLAAVGDSIPYTTVAINRITEVGIPMPAVMQGLAIGFLVLGSLSVIVGFKARLGALLLFLFLAPATFLFHNFWAMGDELPMVRDLQVMHFMKNLSLMGAMLFIVGSGSGAWSIDAHHQASLAKAKTGREPVPV